MEVPSDSNVVDRPCSAAFVPRQTIPFPPQAYFTTHPCEGARLMSSNIPVVIPARWSLAARPDWLVRRGAFRFFLLVLGTMGLSFTGRLQSESGTRKIDEYLADKIDGLRLLLRDRGGCPGPFSCAFLRRSGNGTGRRRQFRASLCFGSWMDRAGLIVRKRLE